MTGGWAGYTWPAAIALASGMGVFLMDFAAERYVENAREETRYRNDYQHVNCISTSGQAFAIWLNLMYLLPLT